MAEPAESLGGKSDPPVRPREPREKTVDKAGLGPISDPPKQLRKGKSEFEHGVLTVRIYQMTADALNDLGRMSRDTALFTGASLGLIGFGVDLFKDVSLAAGAPADKVAAAAAVGASALFIGVVLGVAAVLKWLEREAKLKEIKKNVKFLEAE